MAKPLLSLICAMDRNRLIGINNELPWHLPADLAFFKKTTMGKPVIMGRKTFESIGKPLPGRQNIVITSNQDWQAKGCDTANSIGAALNQVDGEPEIMLIGGASLFQQTIHLADRLYLTLIEHTFEGDTWFPEIDSQQWIEEEVISVDSDEKNPYSYSFIKYIRDKF